MDNAKSLPRAQPAADTAASEPVGLDFARSRRDSLRRKLIERSVHAVLFLCALISVLTTTGIVITLLGETIQFFGEVSIVDFLTGTRWTPLFASKSFGVLPLVNGTIVVALVAIVVAVPIGLLTAIFLSEFAPTRLRSLVKPVLEVLAGIPTVVYGYFALQFVTPILRDSFPRPRSSTSPAPASSWAS